MHFSVPVLPNPWLFHTPWLNLPILQLNSPHFLQWIHPGTDRKSGGIGVGGPSQMALNSSINGDMKWWTLAQLPIKETMQNGINDVSMMEITAAPTPDQQNRSVSRVISYRKPEYGNPRNDITNKFSKYRKCSFIFNHSLEFDNPYSLPLKESF